MTSQCFNFHFPYWLVIQRNFFIFILAICTSLRKFLFSCALYFWDFFSVFFYFWDFCSNCFCISITDHLLYFWSFSHCYRECGREQDSENWKFQASYQNFVFWWWKLSPKPTRVISTGQKFSVLSSLGIYKSFRSPMTRVGSKTNIRKEIDSFGDQILRKLQTSFVPRTQDKLEKSTPILSHPSLSQGERCYVFRLLVYPI